MSTKYSRHFIQFFIQRIGMCWDLDFVASTNDWIIKILDEKTISNLYKINDLGTNGTYALWENIDRIVDNTVKVKFEEEIYSKIDIVKKHLELVFHRYLDGEFGKFDISINDDLINGFDPFNKKNNATRLLAEDSIDIDGHTITIQPFILPHHSKVSKKELANETTFIIPSFVCAEVTLYNNIT